MEPENLIIHVAMLCWFVKALFGTEEGNRVVRWASHGTATKNRDRSSFLQWMGEGRSKASRPPQGVWRAFARLLR